jgi:hypothetical protein
MTIDDDMPKHFPIRGDAVTFKLTVTPSNASLSHQAEIDFRAKGFVCACLEIWNGGQVPDCCRRSISNTGYHRLALPFNRYMRSRRPWPATGHDVLVSDTHPHSRLKVEVVEDDGNATVLSVLSFRAQLRRKVTHVTRWQKIPSSNLIQRHATVKHIVAENALHLYRANRYRCRSTKGCTSAR